MHLGYSYQLEGIATIDGGNYYISTEQSFSGPSGLFRFNLSKLSSSEQINQKYSVYPNPTEGFIQITSANDHVKEVYSTNGKFILSMGYLSGVET